MAPEHQEIVDGKALAAKSSEVEFAIVLSRVIASMENDPAQLRSGRLRAGAHQAPDRAFD
jgi:hypothetical protein